jgi:hypothetical protein
MPGGVMKALLLTMFLAALTLQAADITGKWSGSIDLQSPDGARNIPIFLNLKQEGDKITGTGGNSESDVHTVSGKADGNKLSLEAEAGNAPILFELVVDGDRITGTASKQRDDGSKEGGKVSLKKLPG